MGLFYWVTTNLMRTALLLLSRWRVVGRDNVPRTGPLLVVCNHVHFMDPPLLGASLGRKLAFMAKEELFRSTFVRLCVTAYGGFPVRRDQADREAMRRAQRLLGLGKAVVMFPEGGRSADGNLGRGHPGIAFLALRSEALVLPVAISGSYEIQRLRDYFRRLPITVTIGQPFRLTPTQGNGLRAMSDQIMERIAALLPPERRGPYAGERSAVGAR